MPAIEIGLSSYERASGDLPELPVINMYAEATQSESIVLQSRPALVDRGADMGSGPVRQLFRRDNVLSTALFGVSGTTLYRNSMALGTIDGSEHVSMAGYESLVFVTAGETLFGWDGATFGAIAFPDSAAVTKCIVGASRLIAIRADTGRFYWSEPLTSTIDALDFATAESQPDRALDLLFIDDILLIFGAETVEFWPNTSDDNLPFRPLEGRVIEKGIKATGCATQIGSTFAWVTNENQVCLQDENNVISNEGLEERIASATECSLFRFYIDGIEFLALRMDGETQVWSLRTRTWSEFQTYGQSNFAAQCYADGVFGSAIDGKTLEWGNGFEDAIATGGILERRFRGGFPLNSSGVPIDNVQIRANVGQTGFVSGTYANPSIEMRVSRDAGQTWGLWKGTKLGEQGKYRQRVQWRALGMASRPGFLAEWRVTDPVSLRVSEALVNEQYGGR